MIRWLAVFVAVIGYVLLSASSVSAEPVLGLQPLQYTETLNKGERKQAYIDVTNPTPQAIDVQFGVQGFRQVDDNGTLTFYDDEKVTQGILLDYQEKQIPANKTLRLFFVVDGTKLPSGDVFAAIFAQTKPVEAARVPSVRVGTLLILTNGTPGVRQASIEELNVPVLHTDDAVTGKIKIKNTAPTASASGFFPKITIATWPFGPNTTVTGPLVYAGNTRTVSFDLPSNQLGVYKITASYGDSSKSQWVLLMTGIWKWIVLAGLGLILIGLFAYKFARKQPHNKP